MTRHPLIVCDHGENRSGVPQRLRGRGCDVELQSLPAGDYLVSAAFAIERKAERDFASSIRKRKLREQLARIADQYEYAALLIEGDSWHGDRNLRQAMIGELYHWISLRPNLSVLYTPNANWTAGVLAQLAATEQSGAPAIFDPTPPPVIKAPKTPRDLMLGFPGVGPAAAEKLLAHFGSVRAAANASEGDLKRLIGPTRGAQLHALFNAVT